MVILWVVLGLCGLFLVLVAEGVLWFVSQWRKAGELADGDIDDEMGYDELADEFFVESGPTRFRYSELAAATKNFSERKLGQGGFGAVYRGFLRELGLAYAAEVRIISQLRHRHLVRLVGWCHEHHGDFLLVYELMPNGSVDRHLYGKQAGAPPLSWPTRYNVALGLASALLYHHNECPQCVVHRDTKPSNVMRCSTPPSAPSSATSASPASSSRTASHTPPRESDKYIFGVVALEVACGRRPAELDEEPSKARLVPWVWELYGKRDVLEAADQRLNGKFDLEQMERLMVVGLWCAHPDYAHRPLLPPKMPVPSYLAVPVSVGGSV
ncbi:hypothetical protein E2562_016941 [Oryza meyeriana var. granulata]|uniref:Protein kinase domain-containing protein n=1 Tax=Oryza meyeriana var. granulata TaxID=110450 RepID=A0A6G1DXA2_9ORYZ|nr:hypothetical protein E2562_016941 [Oryza meyeriana var. granulata]